MPLTSIEPDTLTDLKREALSRAETLGHHLRPFRASKHDPLCYVSFCNDCRQMVIVTVEGGDDLQHGALYGYALEARCAAQHGSEVRQDLASAGSR